MISENPELKKQQSISAAEHPKAWDPQVLILGLPLAVVGCIIGLELIVRTGVTPNTSIIGALFAILLSRIPVAFLRNTAASTDRISYRPLSPQRPFPQRTV